MSYLPSLLISSGTEEKEGEVIVKFCIVVGGTISANKPSFGGNNQNGEEVFGMIVSLNYGEVRRCLVEDSEVAVSYRASGIIGKNYGLMEECCGLRLKIIPDVEARWSRAIQ